MKRPIQIRQAANTLGFRVFFFLRFMSFAASAGLLTVNPLKLLYKFVKLLKQIQSIRVIKQTATDKRFYRIVS
jgi:hypothetical protein